VLKSLYAKPGQQFKIVVVVAGPHKDIETMGSSLVDSSKVQVVPHGRIGLRSSLYPRWSNT